MPNAISPESRSLVGKLISDAIKNKRELKEVNKQVQLDKKEITKYLYKPYPIQEKIENDKHRVRVVCCGRRWGKTIMAYNLLIKKAFEHSKSTCWWIAPIYKQAERVYRLVNEQFANIIESKRESDLRIILKNKSLIQFRSAEKPDNLRGEGLKFVVMDEAAMMPDDIWAKHIEPMLLDTKGTAFLISTPNGKNWFYEVYMKGQDESNNRYQSWSYPTITSPYISEVDLEEVKSEIPEHIFRQEYEARFVDSGKSVFTNYMDCIGECLVEKPNHSHLKYTAGLDLGRKHDYTCLIVMENRSRKVVYFDRFNIISWTKQIENVVEVCKNYNNAELWVDATGLGDPIFEFIRNRGINATDFIFTNENKRRIVEQLILDFERNTIMIPDIKELLDELESFTYKLLPSGKVQYAAAGNLHDDCVFALALANHATPDISSNSGLVNRIGKDYRKKKFSGF